MSLQFPSGGGAGVEMFSLYSGTSKTISMFSGGSATFAGSVDVAGLTVNGIPVSGDVDLSGYDTSAEVDQKIANLVGTASSTLDTLGEIADALSDNQSVDYKYYGSVRIKGKYFFLSKCCYLWFL